MVYVPNLPRNIKGQFIKYKSRLNQPPSGSYVRNQKMIVPTSFKVGKYAQDVLLEFNSKEITRNIELLQAEMQAGTAPALAYEIFLQDVLTEARKLVPLKYGVLSNALTIYYSPKEHIGVVTVDPTSSANNYAAMQHETPPPPADRENPSINPEDLRHRDVGSYWGEYASEHLRGTGAEFYSHEHGRAWEPRFWKFLERPFYSKAQTLTRLLANTYFPELKRRLKL